MTDNQTRIVEEPTGYDHPPTDRIPVPGDLSERDTTVGWSEDEAVDPPQAMPEPEPVDRIEREEPLTEPSDTHVTGSVEPNGAAGFFPEGTVNGFRDRWRELQAGFVDDPQQAVHSADELVNEIMRELAERKQSIDAHWRDGGNDTEELRVAIQEYRSFLNQLLNA
jgi:hypothetical protein